MRPFIVVRAVSICSSLSTDLAVELSGRTWAGLAGWDARPRSSSTSAPGSTASMPGRDRFAARVTRAFAAVRPDSAAPLSERDTAVLALLPSLLSTPEIAAELTISDNTVKT